ncbi:MAG: glycosyltransferase family 2 protein, partial [Verrucomicrobiae bacterium]|nr:glycosyltransferase family 2 protein [Verrucomicrobiae bacterium]
MTEALPRVSVCIPTHRRPDYLRQAIASVRAGSEQNFEIVISDDAGELESRRVADSFQDARIRYLPFNGDGIAANWSNALKQARAPYAFKLDDDDEIEPAFLTRCCDFLDAHPAAAVVFTGFTYLHPDKAPRAQIDSVYWNGCDAVAGLDYARDILLNRAYPLNHKSAGVFRKAAAERAKFFDVVTVDVIFSAALAASGEVGYIPEALFRYHVRDAKHEGMEQRPLRML